MFARIPLLLLMSLILTSPAYSQYFRITNAQSGKVLDVTNFSQDDGALIQQYQWTGNTNQQWQLVPDGNGHTKIVSVLTGKVLDVSMMSLDNGARIQQWDSWGTLNQSWDIVSLDSSYNRIVNVNSGKDLDVTDQSDEDGAPIQQWPWWGGLCQQWQIDPVPNDHAASTVTTLYHDPGSNEVFATATSDADYASSYYYGTEVIVQVKQNGQYIGENCWGCTNPNEVGFGTAGLDIYSPPGSGYFYEARSIFSLVTQYSYEEVTEQCGNQCDSFYDPFSYWTVMEDPQGSSVPNWSTTVWGPIVLSTVLVVTNSTKQLGEGGDAIKVPGLFSVLPMTFRGFIPPAYVMVPMWSGDFCASLSYGAQSLIYAGDNRTFAPFATNYRFQTLAAVDMTSGSFVYPPAHTGGWSTRYARDALQGYTLVGDDVLHDCHLTDHRLQEESSLMEASTVGSNVNVTVTLSGAVGDQLTIYKELTPYADYNLSFTFDTSSNPNQASYTVDATHDCYPAYEAYVGSTPVYQWKPPDLSFVGFAACLAGVGQIHTVINNAAIVQ